MQFMNRQDTQELYVHNYLASTLIFFNHVATIVSCIACIYIMHGCLKQAFTWH